MIPQTLPFVTNSALVPQPAPVGSPLLALRLGQEVRHGNGSALGIFLLTSIPLFCNFVSMHLARNLLLLQIYYLIQRLSFQSDNTS